MSKAQKRVVRANMGFGHRINRLQRIKRRGLSLPDDKVKARAAIEQACASHPITHVPPATATKIPEDDVRAWWSPLTTHKS
jgi:hypothetical protein